MNETEHNYTVQLIYYQDNNYCSGNLGVIIEEYPCYNDNQCYCDGSLDDCSIWTSSIKTCLDSVQFDFRVELVKLCTKLDINSNLYGYIECDECNTNSLISHNLMPSFTKVKANSLYHTFQ